MEPDRLISERVTQPTCLFNLLKLMHQIDMGWLFLYLVVFVYFVNAYTDVFENSVLDRGVLTALDTVTSPR